jgi:hypothetical protein
MFTNRLFINDVQELIGFSNDFLIPEKNSFSNIFKIILEEMIKKELVNPALLENLNLSFFV